MRILKYLFLLFLLAIFASTVYVATLKGDFEVERSIVINSPRTTLFNYINDFRNWETFGSWKKEDSGMTFNYPKNTVGTGGSYSWTGNDNEGEMKTTAVITNQSIRQKMNYNGTEGIVTWQFKDTTGGTKVSWRVKGIMSFKCKVSSIFSGGADQVFGAMYEKSLANLGKTIDYEMKTYKIKVDGAVKKSGTFYLKQTITSKISNVPHNLRILIPKMIHFFAKNQLVMYGKPFVIYHTYDMTNGITKLSVCIPVKEEIRTTEESEITSGLLYPFSSVKTTLTGDYSHSKEAWDKTIEYIKKNNFTQNTDVPRVEIYTKNMVQVANPSKWITEIYIPIKATTITAEVPKKEVQPTVSPTVAPISNTQIENKTP
ncbi:MAG: SRPBCC family protein [Flavobacterium sp.]|nr:SRPBCC family protein [Flavobacterium sp.]